MKPRGSRPSGAQMGFKSIPLSIGGGTPVSPLQSIGGAQTSVTPTSTPTESMVGGAPAPEQSSIGGGIGGNIVGGGEQVREGTATRLTPEEFERRSIAARESFFNDLTPALSGPGNIVRRLERAMQSRRGRPWGPYDAIRLEPVESVDLDPASISGVAPNQAQEWFARRQIALIRMREVLSRFGIDSFEWRGGATGGGVLYEEMDRQGIMPVEQQALRAMPSAEAARFYIDSLTIVSPYLKNEIFDLQARRDRALREIPPFIARISHDPGTANWRGAVQFHFDNRGITAEERDALLAGNLGILGTMSPISPFALLAGKAIVDPINPNALRADDFGGCQCPTRAYFTQVTSPLPLAAFTNVMLETPTGAAVSAMDLQLRIENGLAARGSTYYSQTLSREVTEDVNRFYRRPRSSADFELIGGVRRPTPFFKYQWTVLRNSATALNPSLADVDAFLLPEYEVLVAPACAERGPQPRAAARWEKVDSQVFLRGQTGQAVPGPMVPHYCDLSVARWWFEIALALASDNAIIARLDSVDINTGLFPEQVFSNGDWNPIGWYAQTYYVRAIAEALANAYNALNIPWYIDPVARALYRDWFAGHDTEEFNARSNYNEGNWFTNTEQCEEKRYTVLRARIPPNSWENPLVGEMPARLSRMWNVTHQGSDRRTLEFLQKAGVMLWAGSAERDPYIAESAYNRGFASGFAMGWDVFFASPLGLNREPTDAEMTLYRNQGKRLGDAIGQDMSWDLSDSKPTLPASIFADDWYAQIIHAPPLQDRNNICDWRAGGFDPAGGLASIHVQGTVPLRWYVAWLREWATACTTIAPVSEALAPEMPTVSRARRWRGFQAGAIPRRTVGNVLRDAKSYALDINLTWGAQFGGQAGFANALGQRAREFGAAQPNAAVRMGGAVIGALAGQVTSMVTTASGPGLTGLSQSAGALATASVSTIADLLSVAIPSYNCASYGRDDLGRAKPNFERTSLSGNALTSTAPTLTLQVPSGFCRSIETMPDPVPMPVPRPPVAPPVRETRSSSSGTIAAIGVATVGVGIAAAVWLSRRPKVR